MGTANTGISMDKAELLSTVLEAILYGFSLLMFGGTMWALLVRQHTHRVNRTMLTVSCLLLLLSTVHMVIDVVRIMQGLVLYRDNYPGGPVAFFSDVSQWTFVSKNFVYVVQSLVGDGVILYRCYVVWQSKLVMILPALLWCSIGVGGFGAAITATHEPRFEVIMPWVRVFYIMTFSTNMLATVLLTCRIWRLSDKKSEKLLGHSGSPVRKVLHIIVDAGALYNVTILVAWICFSLHSNAQFVTLNIITPIISISFYMIIIRVGLLPFERTSSIYTDTRKKIQVHITTLTENKVEHSIEP